MEHVSDLDVSRIIDYVCMLSKPCFARGQPLGPNETMPFERAVLEHQFPEENHDDIAFPAEVLDLFCFPSADPCALTPAPHPFFSTFILTDASGHRTYVSSLQWLAREHNNASLCYKCLCLVGRIPLYSLHEAVLIQTFALLSLDETREAHAQSVPVAVPERILNYLIHAAPVPGNKEVLSLDFGSHRLYYGLGLATDCISMNEKKQYRNVSLPHVDDAMFNVLFHTLSPDQIVTLVEVLLQEKRVLFHSKKTYRLTAVCESISALLFPFDWSNVFIPVLPHDLLHYVEAPMPYIIGIHSSCMSSSEWDDLNPEQMPTVIVDIDNNFIDRNPPWLIQQQSNGAGGAGRVNGKPRPPPAGFKKKTHSHIVKDIYRLVPSSLSHNDHAHFHNINKKPFYRSPVTGHRFEFNPKRAARAPPPHPKTKIEMHTSSPMSKVAKSTATAPSVVSPSSSPAIVAVVDRVMENNGLGKKDSVSSMFIQGSKSETTVLCGGAHHRWIDEVRVIFLRAVTSLLINEPKWDLRRHVVVVDDNDNQQQIGIRRRGGPSFDPVLFLSTITDTGLKPLVRRLLDTQMFAQFMESLSTTAPDDVAQLYPKRSRTGTGSGILRRTPKLELRIDIDNMMPGEVSNAKEDDEEDEAAEEEDDDESGHVHLWSIIEIASKMNLLKDDHPQIMSSSRWNGVTSTPKITRVSTTPKISQRRMTPAGPPPTNQPSGHYGPLPATPPPPPSTPRSDSSPGAQSASGAPRPPNTPPPNKSAVLSSNDIQEQDEEEMTTEEADAIFGKEGEGIQGESENEDEGEDEGTPAQEYEKFMTKLCRSVGQDPIKTLHEEEKKKDKEKGNEPKEETRESSETVILSIHRHGGIKLLRVPSAPPVLLEETDFHDFETHTCLWGHYTTRNLTSRLYGKIPIVLVEEDGEDEAFSTTTSTQSSSAIMKTTPLSRTHELRDEEEDSNEDLGEEDEEGDTFLTDEDNTTSLSPGAATSSVVSTPSSTPTPAPTPSNAGSAGGKKRSRRMSLRTKNSYRQKSRNAVQKKKEKKENNNNRPKRIATRRHSTFAAVGTNDLSYLGVTANRFAEIQSSIWSQVLPTMGKVSSKITKRGRRVSMIGNSSGGLPKFLNNSSDKKKKTGVLQKMMAQHAEDAKNEIAPLTPQRLLRGGSVQSMVGKKTTASMLKMQRNGITPLRSNVGGSGGQNGKFGRTPAKSTTKRGGALRFGHHKNTLSMAGINWDQSTVSPSMNTLLAKRLYRLSIDNVKALGKERLLLKKRLLDLEIKMKEASVTAMIRYYQLNKIKDANKQNSIREEENDEENVTE